jgi:hypothetical protein
VQAKIERVEGYYKGMGQQIVKIYRNPYICLSGNFEEITSPLIFIQ